MNEQFEPENTDNNAAERGTTGIVISDAWAERSAPGTDEPPPRSPPEVFRTPNGRAFAMIDGRTLAVDSRDFREVVKYELLDDASEAEVRRYIHALKATAQSKPPEDLFVRTARAADAVYVDLANAAGQVVAITAQGWTITSEAPVRFARPSGTTPLTCPQSGGSYRDLQKFIPLGDRAFCLLIAQLTYFFQHAGPQPLAIFVGEQGSAKSTATRLACRIVDPRSPELRRPPGSTRDLMVAADRAWLVVYDNVSELKPWLSDSLCVLSTGGGFGTRKNHTDSDETTFDLRRPVLMNGIEDFVRRDDLRDRCIVYELEPIPATKRCDETTLFTEFSTALPGILGSLFDLCGGALAQGKVSAPELPRMADFYMWALAIERAAGWAAGTIERAYSEQRQAADAGAMEEPLIAALTKFVEGHGEWLGTSTELLVALEPFAPVRERRSKWPEGPPRLGGELRRLAPLLRRGGVSVSFLRSGLVRRIALARITREVPAVPSQPSLLSQPKSVAGTDLGVRDGARSDDQDKNVHEGCTPAETQIDASANSGSVHHGIAALTGGSDGGDGNAGSLRDVLLGEETLSPIVGDIGAEGSDDNARTLSEDRKKVPPRRQAIQQVLRGQHMTAAQVVDALRAGNLLSEMKNPVAAIGRELTYGAKDGHFVWVARGVYTY